MSGATTCGWSRVELIDLGDRFVILYDLPVRAGPSQPWLRE